MLSKLQKAMRCLVFLIRVGPHRSATGKPVKNSQKLPNDLTCIDITSRRGKSHKDMNRSKPIDSHNRINAKGACQGWWLLTQFHFIRFEHDKWFSIEADEITYDGQY
jgi:hypothetical protein